MEGIIKKIIYYRDIKLLLRICLTDIKILFILKKDNRSIAGVIPPVNRNSKKISDINKITRYVDLCMFIFRKSGFEDTCLTRSVLLCSVLRRAGIEAKVNFGTEHKDGRFVGHCWLDYNKEEGKGYKLLCSYPLRG